DSDVEDTKPIMSLIDKKPVVQDWQIETARWMSVQYLTPLNACLRLFLPPGLTRWADVTISMNPYFDGELNRLTPLQKKIIDLLDEKGDLRGRKLRPLLPKSDRKKWQTAVNQLARRGIVRKATVLDPLRIRPKSIKTAELIAGPKQIEATVHQLGRKTKAGSVLHFLLNSLDPLPEESEILSLSGADLKILKDLEEEGYLERIGGGEAVQLIAEGESEREETFSLPSALGLAASRLEIVDAILALQKGESYGRVLKLLAAEAQPLSVQQIYEKSDVALRHLKKLASLDLIRFGSEEVWRDPLADRDFAPTDPPLLTEDQARVWGRIKVSMLMAEADSDDDVSFEEDESDEDEDEDEMAALPPFLLHGVTGSGKTEIYMRAIEYALSEGKTAIVLVPEIALTPQTVRRFAARFPGRVAVMHSRLSDGERYDTWRRAKQGLFDIIIGPRSALFVPMQNIGVIVLDEEHDNSYKQTPPVPAPYYHARDVAIALGRITGAAVILGSATPDVVTYHRAQAGRYELLKLERRVMGHRQRIESQATRLDVISHYAQLEDDPDDALTIPLPPIQIVDLRQELRAGNRSIFSRALQDGLTETLNRGEQAIIFLNRRGSSTFVFCRDCGHTMKCPHCDIPLTFHRPGAHLVCHQCGHTEPQPDLCPSCGSKKIKYFGMGTELLEQELQRVWPEAKLTRWDRDTTAGKDSHENLLAAFIDQEANVLVGTQMIAKGLDLPLVTLVGVILADVSLGLPDFSTGERAFQTLAQVAGRAGRGLLGGRVILQTYQPEHYAINAAADHDYTSFYLDEIRFRTQHGLPPFRRLAKLLFTHHSQEYAKNHAEQLASELRWHAMEKSLSQTEILGPQPPFFARLGGRFRWQIIIRSPDPLRLLEGFSIPPKWVIDIDPVSML
ncbi:MAG: primosomal protein N', partial [Chloroflexota bacterium]